LVLIVEFVYWKQEDGGEGGARPAGDPRPRGPMDPWVPLTHGAHGLVRRSAVRSGTLASELELVRLVVMASKTDQKVVSCHVSQISYKTSQAIVSLLFFFKGAGCFSCEKSLIAE